MDGTLWLKLVFVHEWRAIGATDEVRLEAAFLHKGNILLTLKSFAVFFPTVCLVKQPLRQPRGSLTALKRAETRSKLSLAVTANQLRTACISFRNLWSKRTVLLNFFKLLGHLCSISFCLLISVRLSQYFPSVTLRLVSFDHLPALLVDLRLKRAFFIEPLLCS